MIKQRKLVEYLDDYLAIDTFDDSSWNGLQVEGKDDVEHVALGVTAGAQLFEEAAKIESDFLIVHHGHFWKTSNPSLVGWKKGRLASLFEHDISLYAAHLPLDRHPEIGNNAELLRLIGAEPTDDFFVSGGVPISWMGDIPRGRHISEIEEIVRSTVFSQTVLFPFGPPIVQKVAVCTGSGGYSGIEQAIEAGADLYITGDTVEIYHTAKDAGIHLLFAGHHTTELLGIQALGERIEQGLDLKVSVIDIPTEL